MSSRVRFVAAASLIAFGALIAVGVPALLPSAGEHPLVAIADASRSVMPWIGGSRSMPAAEPATAATEEVAPEAASPSEPPLKQSRVATASPQDMVQQKPVSAVSTPEEAPQPAAAPQAPAQQKPVQQELPRQSALTAPVQETPVQRPAAIKPRAAIQPRVAVQPPAARERHAARTTTETPDEATAPKKAPRRDRPAKRPTNEALSTVRKFDDTLQGIPVNSYAADGTPKRIVIRPTSIQDVYYYSSRPQ